jgi:DDE superfamily endonuclease
LRPIPGIGLARVGHPRRQRATYRRTQGTEQFLGFYDVHGDCLMGTCRRRKTARDILAAFRRLRSCYPRRLRLYVIMDNLNTHRHPVLQIFYRRHRIPTPTYASWLNLIESHLGAMRRFTLNGSDDPMHLVRRCRISRYLTWRNRRAGSTNCRLYRFRSIKLDGH